MESEITIETIMFLVDDIQGIINEKCLILIENPRLGSPKESTIT